VKQIRDFLSDKFTVNVAIVIAILIVYLGFFFRPRIRQLAGSLPKASRTRAQIVSVNKEWKNLDSFKEGIANSNKKIDYYEKKLPREKDIPNVLQYLSSSARKLNVRLTEIKPMEKTEDGTPTYYSVPILLKAECGYHQLGRFLSELEKADRFMKVVDVEIVSNVHRKINALDVQLVIITYVMRQE